MRFKLLQFTVCINIHLNDTDEEIKKKDLQGFLLFFLCLRLFGHKHLLQVIDFNLI